jgi:cyanophycin synthetase
LSRTANISSGGTAEDVTGSAHPDNIALAERAARIIGLDIAGIDLLCPDISRSWREVGAAICEVNGQPGFRPHWLADPERDINGEILDILFAGRSARIPTAAITGTNGKTTTAEMLYRIWTAAGRRAGVCTTAVVRIDDQIVSTENLSGQPGARIILNDPGVEAAVLEMPRKGLIYFGHPCDRYDVAALLNVQDDHLGVDGIHTLEQMAEIKAEVLQRATRAIVVNAEDPLCMAMRVRASAGRHILVARTPEVGALAEHRRGGGEAVFLDTRGGRRMIVLAAAATETELMPVDDVPATMNGLLACNESNALFAAALAWAHGIDHDAIRHPAHLEAVAGLVASCFDEFVLGCDPVLVGAGTEYAGDDPVASMLDRWAGSLRAQGVDPSRITVEADRRAALRAALDRARAGDLVVLLADWHEARDVIDHWRGDTGTT